MAAQQQFLGRGIRFPVRPDPMTGAFETTSYEEDIKEAIGIIIMTKKGERMMRPEFGCAIHNYTFAAMDYTTMQLMGAEVEQALIMWEPRIKDIRVRVRPDAVLSGRLYIEIEYLIRMTNNPYNLVYPYYINEGMGDK